MPLSGVAQLHSRNPSICQIPSIEFQPMKLPTRRFARPLSIAVGYLVVVTCLTAQITIEYTGGNPGEDDSGDYNLVAGATLQLNGSNTQMATQSGVISGIGPVTKTGDGTLVLTADNIYSGGTTVSAGTLQFGNAGTTGSIQGNITNNSNLDFFHSGAVTFAGNIDGTGTLRKSGTNTLTLTGTNTYAGLTTIAGGSLVVGNGSTSGSLTGNVNISNSSSTLVFNRSDAASFAGNITGSGKLTKDGEGTLTLTGTHTYAGVTTISGGALQFSGDGSTTGSLPGNVTNNGSLILNWSDDVFYMSIISGTGSVTKDGAGLLGLYGFNTYSGSTTVSAGTLSLNQPGILSATARLSIASGASVTFNNGAQSIGSLEGAGELALGTDNLTVGGDDTSSSYSGVLSGSGSLTKTGEGTLSLSGANTHSGATTVSAGTLSLGADNVLPNSAALTVASGATVNFNDHSDTIGSLTGAGDVALGSGTLTLGGNNASTTYGGELSGTGSVIKTGTGTWTLTGDNIYTGTLSVSVGGVQIGNGGTTGTLDASAITLGNSTTDPGEQTPMLTFSRSNDLTFNGTIDGRHVFDGGEGTYEETVGTLTKQGAGTLTFSRPTEGDAELRIDVRQLDLQGGTLALDSGLSASAYIFTLGTNPVTLSGGTFYLGSLDVGTSGGDAGYDADYNEVPGLAGTAGTTGNLTLANGITVATEYVTVGGHGGGGESSFTDGVTGTNGGAGAEGTLTLGANTIVNVDNSWEGTVGGNGGSGGAAGEGGTGGDGGSGGAGTLTLGAGATFETSYSLSVGGNGGDGPEEGDNSGGAGGEGGDGLVELGTGASLIVGEDDLVVGGRNGDSDGSGTAGLGGDGTITVADEGIISVSDGSLVIRAGRGTVTLGAAAALDIANGIEVGGTLALGDNATLSSESLSVDGGTFTLGANVSLSTYYLSVGGGSTVTLDDTITITTDEETEIETTHYDTVTLGEVTVGGQGGDAGWSFDDEDPEPGSAGGAGTLSLGANMTLTTEYIALGGTGGDSQGELAGGAGGAGTLTLGSQASVLVTEYGSIQVGGDAGGGAGGVGTLTVGTDAIVSTDTLRVGGDSSTSSLGGAGTVSLAAGSSLDAVEIYMGGRGGTEDGEVGGSGTLTVGTGASVKVSALTIGGIDTHSEVTGDRTGGAGTLNLGAGTLTVAGYVDPEDPEYTLAPQITVTNHGTFNVGYDGTSGTAAPTLALAEDTTIVNDGLIHVRNTSGSVDFGGVAISGEGSVQKSGAGTLILAGINTYTGATTISGGTLVNNGSIASDVTVQSGGAFKIGSEGSFTGDLTLEGSAQFDNDGTYAAALTLGDGQTLGGSGTFSGLVTTESGAHLAPGNSPGTLTFDGGLTLVAGTIIDFELGLNAAASDLILVTGGSLTGPLSGVVTFNFSDAGGFAAGTTYSLIDGSSLNTILSDFDALDFEGIGIDGYTFAFSLNGKILEMTASVSAVPEPSTYAAIIGALALAGAFVRRRAKAAQA